tara:strand:- start:5047 stop:6078 length:1032 start_codon:yes stop_codon:yes gene_type:complete
MDEEDLLAVTLGGPTSVNAQSSSTFDPNDPYGEFGSPVNDPNANPLGLLSNLLTTATGSVVANQGIQRQEQLGRQAVALADQLIADTERRGTFRPFTVTTDLATTATTPEGGFGVTLGQTPRDIQDQALTQALTGIQGLGASRSQREQEIFDRLEAIRQPQRNRELQGLLNAENAAGRLGLGLDAYGGGNPNLFGRQQVIEEQRARDALTAIEAARQERADDLALTQGLLEAGYSPQSQALAGLAAGRDVATLPQDLQKNVLTAATNTGRTGIEQLILANQAANVLRDQRDANLLQGLLGEEGREGLDDIVLGALSDTGFGQFLDQNPLAQGAIGGLLGGIFG